MKVTVLKAELSVPIYLKRYAMLLTMLSEVYGGEREKLIRDVAHFYRVTL